jgi:hypothetical protein
MKAVIAFFLVVIIATSALALVELSSMEAIPGDARVTIHWVSASEYNNAWFEVVRDSVDTVATVAGAGNRSFDAGYCFIDNSVQNGVTYCYTLCAIDNGGNRACWPNGVCATPSASSVPQRHNPVPASHSLSAYPNPFNPSTTISFSLPRTSNVTLSVYDVTGRKVETLIDKSLNAGEHSMDFNGSALPSGLYFARLTAGDVMQTQKMVLLK